MYSDILKIENSILIVVDVQERLMPVIFEGDQLIKNINTLLRGAEILGLDMAITEQYPQGLGRTVSALAYHESVRVYEKLTFSCLFLSSLQKKLIDTAKKNIILCGVESHICVLKTALDALELGYQVHVVADAVSSRTPQNKHWALERIRQSGGYIVTVEMILFMLMDVAGTSGFRSISKLIK